MQLGGALPVATLAIRPAGRAWTDQEQQDFVIPQALTLDAIARIVVGYALDAGFDGGELHGAIGYLPGQFLSSGTNTRSDAYGGRIENRARFLLRVLDAMIAEAGPGRVGLKISPGMNLNDISDDGPVATYSHLVSHLPAQDTAYLNVTLFGTPQADYLAILRPLFAGNYLVGSGLNKATAEVFLNDRKAAGTVFGAEFLVNPDLVERFRADAPLNRRDPATAYTPGAKGYTDYPTLEG